VSTYFRVDESTGRGWRPVCNFFLDSDDAGGQAFEDARRAARNLTNETLHTHKVVAVMELVTAVCIPEAVT
jgi:hypothetical protein